MTKHERLLPLGNSHLQTNGSRQGSLRILCLLGLAWTCVYQLSTRKKSSTCVYKPIMHEWSYHFQHLKDLISLRIKSPKREAGFLQQVLQNNYCSNLFIGSNYHNQWNLKIIITISLALLIMVIYIDQKTAPTYYCSF